jgi:hypothetical protein
VWSAVVLSLAAVSHGIVLIFVAIASVILCLVWIDRRRLVYAATVGVATLLLSAWWVGPFLFGHEFMTDMKYGFRPEGANDSFYDMFFPLTAPLDFLVTMFAIVGFGWMVLRRQLTGIAIGITCIAFVGLVYITRDSLPGIGLLWNPRLLPFVYLTRYLLMVIGILAVFTAVINAVRGRLARAELNAYDSAAAVGAIGLSMLLVFGWMYETLPLDGRVTDGETSVYAWGPFRKGPDAGRAVADGWTRYNMTGYEGRSAYPEYHAVISTMTDIGEQRGCGRALWENNEDNGQYGTTMALMLLPHWTDGCIASMEGLFFEAVPLPDDGGDVGECVEPGSSAALHEQRRRRRGGAHARPRRPVRDVAHRCGQGRGGDQRRPRVHHHVGPVGHLRSPRVEHRRAARDAARRGPQARRGSARAQPRTRHQLVPASRRLAGDPGRPRSRQLAAGTGRDRSRRAGR